MNQQEPADPFRQRRPGPPSPWPPSQQPDATSQFQRNPSAPLRQGPPAAANAHSAVPSSPFQPVPSPFSSPAARPRFQAPPGPAVPPMAPSPSSTAYFPFNQAAQYGQSPQAYTNQPGSSWQAQPPQAFAPVPQPAFVASSFPQEQTRGRGRRWIVITLPLLAVLVLLASIFGPALWQVWQGNASSHGQTRASVQHPRVKQSKDVRPVDIRVKYRQLATTYVARMSLNEELGQLLMVQYATDYYSDDLDFMINQQHVGGVIMYQGKYTQKQLMTAAQAKTDISHMQQRAALPLLIGIDEEGWNVDRLWSIYPSPPNPKRLTADDIHKAGDPAVATSEGQRAAQDMQALGINLNFAPDVDVATLQNGYLDWDYRTFGSTPDDVIKYSSPYLQAMQRNGVIGTLKHFPGLGSVPRGDDPHGTLPIVNETKDQLEQTDLVPYKHFIQSTNTQEQPGFIMPTDVLVPSIDPTYPAEFSHVFMTDILRKELGYDGAVISDSVIMQGVKVNGVQLTQAQASLLAIQAGDDMVLDVSGSDQVTDVINTFKDALQKGTLTKARVDEAASRIIALKMQYHLMPAS